MSIEKASVAFIASFALAVSTLCAEFTVRPSEVLLSAPEETSQLLVTQTEGERPVDLTRQADYRVENGAIARVDSDGRVHAIADGTTRIVITVGNFKQHVLLTVSGVGEPPPVSFEHDVQSILTKARCNSGGCHGKAEGQNGFKLSLFGFDADADHAAIAKESRGRRISFASPEQSPLLLKATASVPHGGGMKVELGSPQYSRLLRWIAAGAPRRIPDDPSTTGIEIEPASFVLSPLEQQQLRVTAVDAAGKRRCVTAEAAYISNAGSILQAGSSGLLTAMDVPGETAVLVRYLGHVAVCRVAVPKSGPVYPRPAENNFIDSLVWAKLQRLGIEPSGLADDTTFLRRAHLDLIGTLPTADEARAFLSDASPDKRRKLVDRLLDRPEYAAYWTMKWRDVLRADKTKVGHQAVVGLSRWLHEQFAQNRPFDAMARDILTAQGPVQAESPAAFFRAVDQPADASRAISQLFLGVRIECAQCHHHPSERWGQDDYVALAGFFTGVKVKKLPDGTDAIVSRGGSDLPHPRSQVAVPARALAAAPADFKAVADRRQVLADWMTAPDNHYFTRALANRLWSHYTGRGLVEPIDDLRSTNPATNEPLLDALAAHLREVNYDLKAFTGTILASRVYQLSSEPTESNALDRQHFSHAWPKALPAEVLLDALSQATGAPEKFDGWPLGTRSIDVWDNRMPSYFFRIFGRPVRATVCECERSNEPSISQALHLLNSPEVEQKIASRAGVARKLAESQLSADEITREIYLGTVSRLPTEDELAAARETFALSSISRLEAAEDVLWIVLNTKEFLYNH